MKIMQRLNLDKSSWRVTKLGELAQDISKRVENPSASVFERFVGLEHFVSGDLKIKKWSTTDNLASSAKAFQAGDILFARRNAYLRRASMVDFEGCCSGDAFVIRENHEKVIPGFLTFLMNSNGLWDYANSNAAGTMSKRVKWRDLANYEFLLPPKEQQAELAELLWAMDEVIEREVIVKSNVETLFDSELNSSINVKNNWKKKPLNTLAKVQTGIAKNKLLRKENDVIKLPYLRVANVQDGYLDLNEMKAISLKAKDFERFKVEIGDVLLTEGGDFDKLGRGYVWRGEIPSCVHQNHVFVVRTNLEVLNPWYFSFASRSKYGKQYFLRCAKKTSNLASINSSQLKEFRVPLPPKIEQDKIVKKLKSIEEFKENIGLKINYSKALQKSLVNQIF